MRGTQQIKNLQLKGIEQQVVILKGSYETISFSHVYREQNMTADLLLKEGFCLRVGFCNKITCRGGHRESEVFSTAIMI